MWCSRPAAAAGRLCGRLCVLPHLLCHNGWCAGSVLVCSESFSASFMLHLCTHLCYTAVKKRSTHIPQGLQHCSCIRSHAACALGTVVHFSVLCWLAWHSARLLFSSFAWVVMSFSSCNRFLRLDGCFGVDMHHATSSLAWPPASRITAKQQQQYLLQQIHNTTQVSSNLSCKQLAGACPDPTTAAHTVTNSTRKCKPTLALTTIWRSPCVFASISQLLRGVPRACW